MPTQQHLIVAVGTDPFAARHCRGAPAQLLLQRFGATQASTIDRRRESCPGQEVEVRVVECGDDEITFAVERRGPRSGARLDVISRTDRENSAAAYRDSAGIRMTAVQGDNATVYEQKVD
jgi:hypothetical protein